MSTTPISLGLGLFAFLFINFPLTRSLRLLTLLTSAAFSCTSLYYYYYY
jgi:hypothetical protein